MVTMTKNDVHRWPISMHSHMYFFKKAYNPPRSLALHGVNQFMDDDIAVI